MISLCQVWWVSLDSHSRSVPAHYYWDSQCWMQPAFCMFHALLEKGHKMQVHSWKVDGKTSTVCITQYLLLGIEVILGFALVGHVGWDWGLEKSLDTPSIYYLQWVVRSGGSLGSKHVAIQRCSFPKDLRLSTMGTQVSFPLNRSPVQSSCVYDNNI